MDDETLLRLMRKTLAGDEYSALTHEHGPYSITRPNHSIARLVELIRAEVLEEAARIAQATVCDTHLPTGVRIYGTRAADAIRAAKEGS